MKYFLSSAFILILSIQSCSGGEEDSTSNDQTDELESSDSLTTDSTSQIEIDFDIKSYEDLENYGSSSEAELSSLDHYWKGYQLIKAGLDEDKKEKSYFGYVSIMQRIAESKYWSWGEFDEEETTADYKPYGLNMAGGEGEYSLMVDTSVPGDIFKGDISDELYQFSQLGKINGRQFGADAGLIMSFEELGAILIDAEERLITNYGSTYFDEFYATYYHLLEYFMYGMENTRVVWPGEKKIDEEVYVAYVIMIEDEDHKSGKIIQEHISRLEESEYDVSYSDRWMPTSDMIHDAFDLPLRED